MRKGGFGIAKDLGADLAAVADGDDVVEHHVAHLLHGLGAVDRRARVEVGVVPHGLVGALVGSQAIHGRDGVSCGGAKTGREDHELATAGDDATHAGWVVAGGVHHDEALVRLELRRVRIDGVEGAVASLVHAAERLLLEGRKSAGHVSRAGVALTHLGAKHLDVLLVVVDDLEDVVRNLLVLRAAGEDVLGAKELGRLAQHGGGTMVDEPVGDLADQRIGAKAARGVGAAAVGAEDELGDVSGLADAPVRLGDHLAGKARTLFDRPDGAADLLDDQGLDGLVGALANRVDHDVVLAALAAQGDANDAIDVRVRSVACQGGNGHLLVAVDLRAAILVVEGDAALDRVRDSFRGVGGADARGKDQDVVADADATVRATVAHEGARALYGRRGLGGDGVSVGDDGVLQVVGAGTVVRMNMLSALDVRGGHTDELAILDDLLTLGDVHEGDLVEQRDVVGHGNARQRAVRHGIAGLGTRLQLVCGDGDVVPLIDDNGVLALAYNV